MSSLTLSSQTETPFHFLDASLDGFRQQVRDALKNKSLNEIRTPALVIDRAIMKRNCDYLGCIPTAHRVKVRVHVKTHKTVEGARLQLDGAKTDAIVVSTLAEAYAMIESSLVKGGLLKEVLLGFPITPDKFNDVFHLASRIQAFQIFIDSLDTLNALDAYHAQVFKNSDDVATHKLRVFVKLDCGYGRAGIPLEANDKVLELVKRLATSPYLILQGLYTHAGHSYQARTPDEALAYLEQECNSAREFQALFRSRLGIDIPYLSIGATPTVQAAAYFVEDSRVRDALRGIHEVHAGAYTLLDRQQVATSLCDFKQVGISVACRVASIYPDRGTVLVDGGALAFSKDTAPQGGYGSILDSDGKEDLILRSVSQEHGILIGNGVTERYSIGDLVRIVPNHCCLAAACHLFYVIVEGDKVVDVWFPVRGW